MQYYDDAFAKQAGHMAPGWPACSCEMYTTIFMFLAMKAKVSVSKQGLKADQTCMNETHGCESFSGKC